MFWIWCIIYLYNKYGCEDSSTKLWSGLFCIHIVSSLSWIHYWVFIPILNSILGDLNFHKMQHLCINLYGIQENLLFIGLIYSIHFFSLVSIYNIVQTNPYLYRIHENLYIYVKLKVKRSFLFKCLHIQYCTNLRHISLII